MAARIELRVRPDRCETCRFWKNADPGDKSCMDGWCHRHAPSPLVYPNAEEEGLASSKILRPLTEKDDWCGEWEKQKSGSKLKR